MPVVLIIRRWKQFNNPLAKKSFSGSKWLTLNVDQWNWRSKNWIPHAHERMKRHKHTNCGTISLIRSTNELEMKCRRFEKGKKGEMERKGESESPYRTTARVVEQQPPLLLLFLMSQKPNDSKHQHTHLSRPKEIVWNENEQNRVSSTK